MKVDRDLRACGTPYGGISHPFHFYQSSVIISQLRDVISVEVDVTAQRYVSSTPLGGGGQGRTFHLLVTAGSPASSQVGPLTAMSSALSSDGEVGTKQVSTFLDSLAVRGGNAARFVREI